MEPEKTHVEEFTFRLLTFILTSERSFLSVLFHENRVSVNVLQRIYVIVKAYRRLVRRKALLGELDEDTHSSKSWTQKGMTRT